MEESKYIPDIPRMPCVRANCPPWKPVDAVESGPGSSSSASLLAIPSILCACKPGGGKQTGFQFRHQGRILCMRKKEEINILWIINKYFLAKDREREKKEGEGARGCANCKMIT